MPEAKTKSKYLAKAEMASISPTSSFDGDGSIVICEYCGEQVLRTIWVNTTLRAVQVSDACSNCDYRRFEPWQIQPEDTVLP